MNGDQVKKQQAIFGEKIRGTRGYYLESFRWSYLKRVFSCLEIPGEGEYLDVGCGALGHLVIEATRRGQKATGLDISQKLVSKARGFAQKELGDNHQYRFVIGRAEKLPFPDKSFTKVSAIAILEHVEDDEKAIAEMARVLKAGGRVFITVPNSFQRIWPPFRWYYRRVDREMGHLRHYGAKDLRRRIERYGFKLIGLHYTGHLPKVIQYFITLLFSPFAKSRLWWKLEEMDFKMAKNSSGLHFDLVAERKQ